MYVLVRTEYVLFCSFLYQLSIISRRYIPCTYWFWLSTYFEFLILLRACRALPVCLRAIQAPGHTLNQLTRKHWQVYSLLLGSTLVSAWAPGRGHWWRAGGFSYGWSALPGAPPPCSAVCSPTAAAPSQQRSARCELACEGLGPQVGASNAVNDELKNIQAILPSSSSEFLSE